MWCIPETSAEYVACMEDVLDVYELPYDPLRPQVCYDEWRRALIGETRTSLPAQPGRRKRVDYEYRRHGVAYLHMIFEPLQAKRHIRVTQQHTMHDFAHCRKWLVDDLYPWAEVIRVVMDNLSTHKPAALYRVFPPEEARRILKKLEFHYTPKHGSWLNMAEIEIGVMNRQCLNRRIDNRQTVANEVAAWEEQRNEDEATVQWTFTVSAARVKLSKIYPSIEI
jgi:hypothetical protein